MKHDWILKKNTGVISILSGIGFLLISFLFSSGYIPDLGLIGSFNNMEIVFVEGEYIETTYYGAYGENVLSPSHYEGRFAIPLKYPITLSIVSILFGIGVVALSKNGDKT